MVGLATDSPNVMLKFAENMKDEFNNFLIRLGDDMHSFYNAID